MEKFEAMQTVGVKAVDGTVFYFSSCGSEDAAREQCKKYEASAKSVVYDRLKNVLVGRERTIDVIGKKDDGTEGKTGTHQFYFDEDLARFLGCYDCKSYIFTPKSDEDIKNLAMYLELEGKTYGCYSSDVNKVEVGKNYIVLIDYDGEYYFVGTLEDIKEILIKALERETARMTAFLKPTEYVLKNGEYVKK